MRYSQSLDVRPGDVFELSGEADIAEDAGFLASSAQLAGTDGKVVDYMHAWKAIRQSGAFTNVFMVPPRTKSLIVRLTGSKRSRLTVRNVRLARTERRAIDLFKGKTRSIFIVRELQKKLLRYISGQKIETGTVFITRTGRPMSRTNIWREMKNLCREAEVNPEKVSPRLSHILLIVLILGLGLPLAFFFLKLMINEISPRETERDRQIRAWGVNKYWVIILLLGLTVSSCSILQAVHLKDCTYEYEKLSDMTFLGMPKGDLLSISGIAKVTKALLGKTETVERIKKLFSTEDFSEYYIEDLNSTNGTMLNDEVVSKSEISNGAITCLYSRRPVCGLRSG